MADLTNALQTPLGTIISHALGIVLLVAAVAAVKLLAGYTARER